MNGGEVMRNKGRDLLVMTFGFTMIALGGFAHILNDALFWYPFGLITVPFISAWVTWIQSRMRKPTIQVNQ